MASNIERWKMAKDIIAFDTINHELLIAKMYAYGLRFDALKILHSSLFLAHIASPLQISLNVTFWLPPVPLKYYGFKLGSR